MRTALAHFLLSKRHHLFSLFRYNFRPRHLYDYICNAVKGCSFLFRRSARYRAAPECDFVNLHHIDTRGRAKTGNITNTFWKSEAITAHSARKPKPRWTGTVTKTVRLFVFFFFSLFFVAKSFALLLLQTFPNQSE